MLPTTRLSRVFAAFVVTICAFQPALELESDSDYALLQTRSFVQVFKKPTRVLFIGNSFTYVHGLPQQFANVANSLGESIEVAQVAINGSFLYYTSKLDVTVQKLEEDWDFIVLQDFSLLPTVRGARDAYLLPTLELFNKRKKKAKVVMYMTWGYENGLELQCPQGGHHHVGKLISDLTEPSCRTSNLYQTKVDSFDCMQYALARGTLATLSSGASLVAPCGLAWQAVRGSSHTPSYCKHAVDREYAAPMDLTLPLAIPNAVTDRNRQLYILREDGTTDKHPGVVGQYLNALVFYTTLFGKSPVGAAGPWEVGNTEIDEQPEVPLGNEERLQLQKLAFETVKSCGKACGWTGVFP